LSLDNEDLNIELFKEVDWVRPHKIFNAAYNSIYLTLTDNC